MALKIFGLSISITTAAKAAEAEALKVLNQAVAGLAANDQVRAKIAEIEASVTDPSLSGAQKLEAVSVEVLEFLVANGFPNSKTIAVMLVQAVYAAAKQDIVSLAKSVLKTLGLIK